MENKTGYKRRKKARSTLRGFDAVSKETPQAERPITKLPGDDAFLIANVVDFCKEKKEKIIQIDIQMRSFRLKGDNRTLFCTEA